MKREAGRGSSTRTVDDVCRTYEHLQRQLAHVLRPANLSYARWRVLRAIHDTDGAVSIQRVADAVGLHRTSVRSVVELLVSAQYVVTEISPMDRRNTKIRLTPAGRAACDLGTRLVESIDVGWLSGRFGDQVVGVE
jgi:DNA-binding MarR family transcriptional regulator